LAGIPDYEPPRAGFGENTVNLAGASLRTLGTNFSNTRRLVQAAREIRDDTRARLEAEERGAERQQAVRDRIEIRDAAREAAQAEARTRQSERTESAATPRETPARPEQAEIAAAPGSGFDVSV
jgi:hypothetical protein